VSNICRISRLVIHPVSMPYNSSSEVEAPTSSLVNDLPCPGLGGQSEADVQEELANLLELADAHGAEARELGLDGVSREGSLYKCITCGKAGRRDRLLAHVVYKHLDIKAWGCPLWFVCFH
jgi:hypothetical protein